MFKFAAPLLAAVCLVGLASNATAAPCVLGATLSCSLSEGQNSGNPEYGFLSAADLAAVGGVPGWFEAWTFVLDNGTNYTGVADNANVSDIVHIYSTGAEMYSQGFVSGGSSFASILAFVLTLTPASTVQVVGDPTGGGARRFPNAFGGEIGLANEGLDGIAHLLDISGPGFSGDSVDIISSVDSTQVPEPATLTLMGIGGLVAAIRRRRKGTL